MTYKRRYLCGAIAWLEFKTSFARLGVITRTAGNRTKPANALHPLWLVRMVRMMGTFDNWANQRDSKFISIVKCIDELANKNDSTIKATISYLFEHLLTAKLYIDLGLRLSLVNNTGLLDLETPNEILTAIFSDIPPTFVNHCKSLPHSVSNKYPKYYNE